MQGRLGSDFPFSPKQRNIPSDSVLRVAFGDCAFVWSPARRTLPGKMIHFSAMSRSWILLCALTLLPLATTQCSRSTATSDQTSKGGQGGGSGKGGKGGGQGGGAAVPVSATQVQTQDMPVYLRGLGTVTAFNTVTVKSRVDGPLIRVNFREGQNVKAGQLLAEIDPRTFQATLNQAKATMAKDEASLHDAQVNLARYQALFKEQVIAQQQLDTQASQVGQFEGQIGADKAQVDAAALQLSFTRISSPISGLIGLRQADVGNMIHAADPNGLAVVTQLQPIAVLFTLPEDQLQQVLQAMHKTTLVAEAYSRDDKTKITEGKLVTVNNAIDTTTGTDKLKAVFDNRNLELWPNQFVNIRLLVETKKNALIIPSAAIIRGSNGSLVYVVKQDGSVESRNIQVGLTEGTTAQIDSGLQAGETVVTDGQDKLQNGAKVTVQAPAGTGGGRGNRNSQNGPGQNPRGQQSSGDQSGQAGQSGGGQPGPTGQTFQRGGPGGNPNGPGAGTGTGNQNGQNNTGKRKRGQGAGTDNPK
jgi:multidrug efflux system membrane fusion protein